MIQTNEIQKFNTLLANYKGQSTKGYDFNRQKLLANLIQDLEKQAERAAKEMEKAIKPIKKELVEQHRAYMKQAIKLGIVNPEPRREKAKDKYRFKYYQRYLQAMRRLGDNTKFSLEQFHKIVSSKRTVKLEQLKNQLTNMANDKLIKKLNSDGTLYATPSENPELYDTNRGGE